MYDINSRQIRGLMAVRDAAVRGERQDLVSGSDIYAGHDGYEDLQSVLERHGAGPRSNTHTGLFGLSKRISVEKYAEALDEMIGRLTRRPVVERRIGRPTGEPAQRERYRRREDGGYEGFYLVEDRDDDVIRVEARDAASAAEVHKKIYVYYASGVKRIWPDDGSEPVFRTILADGKRAVEGEFPDDKLHDPRN